MSYSHFDGAAGRLTALVERAVDKCNQSDPPARLALFADVNGILPGDQWREVIDDAILDADIFPPRISPRYCLSRECAYEFNGFERVRRHVNDGRCCVPLFWEDVSPEYLKIDSFHGEVLERARALNGVDASSLVTHRTSRWQLVEDLLTSDLADALLSAVRHVIELRSNRDYVPVADTHILDAPAFTCGAHLRRQESRMWTTSIEVRSGETFRVRLDYCNRGAEVQQDVILRMSIPTELRISSNVFLFNGNNPEGLKLVGNAWLEYGLNIGHYFPDANAVLAFEACVPELPKNIRGLDCGIHVTCITQEGSRHSNCLVRVRREG